MPSFEQSFFELSDFLSRVSHEHVVAFLKNFVPFDVVTGFEFIVIADHLHQPFDIGAVLFKLLIDFGQTPILGLTPDQFLLIALLLQRIDFFLHFQVIDEAAFRDKFLSDFQLTMLLQLRDYAVIQTESRAFVKDEFGLEGGRAQTVSLLEQEPAIVHEVSLIDLLLTLDAVLHRLLYDGVMLFG